MTSKSPYSLVWESVLEILEQKDARNIIELSCGTKCLGERFLKKKFEYFCTNLSEADIKQYLKSHTGYDWHFVLINAIECIDNIETTLSLLRPGQRLILLLPSHSPNSNEKILHVKEKIQKKYSPLLNIESITLKNIEDENKIIFVVGYIKHKRLEHIRNILKSHGEGIKPPFIHPTAVIAKDFVDIGERVIIMPNVVIGFPSIGAEWDEDGKIVRFPQDGRVKIGNDVFISSSVVIDRATNKENLTEIGDRCVIGPMAHVTHNVHVGNDTMILGNSIITGGAKVGSHCMIGANSTIRHKITIGNGVIVGMGSVVTKNVPDGLIVVGNPARELGKPK